jgi:hypothetical protein
MMKQVTLNIKEGKYVFFMDLIKHFDFVQVEEDQEPSHREIEASLKSGFEDLKKFKKGKLKTTPARQFLDEL